MRISFLAFMGAAVAAATLTAASAFSYADLEYRQWSLNVVNDDTAFLAIEEGSHGCYTGLDGSGRMVWTISGCDGTGINPYSTYYIHDLLKITNKGSTNVATLYVNLTNAAPVTFQTAATSGAMFTTGSYTDTYTGGLNVGSSLWLGLKIDASSTAAPTALAPRLEFDARVTG